MTSTEFYGTLLALGMIAVVFALLGWQRLERSRRGADLSEADQAHFASQDTRRWVVAGIMATLAVGLYLGSQTPNRVNGRPNVAFVAIWLGRLRPSPLALRTGPH